MRGPMRVKSFGLAALLSLSAFMAGCVSDDDPAPMPTDPDPGFFTSAPAVMKDRLAQPVTLRVQSGSVADVTAKRLWGDEITEDAQLAIKSGKVTLQAQADGRIAVIGHGLHLGDIHILAAS